MVAVCGRLSERAWLDRYITSTGAQDKAPLIHKKVVCSISGYRIPDRRSASRGFQKPDFQAPPADAGADLEHWGNGGGGLACEDSKQLAHERFSKLGAGNQGCRGGWIYSGALGFLRSNVVVLEYVGNFSQALLVGVAMRAAAEFAVGTFLER